MSLGMMEENETGILGRIMKLKHLFVCSFIRLFFVRRLGKKAAVVSIYPHSLLKRVCEIDRIIYLDKTEEKVICWLLLAIKKKNNKKSQCPNSAVVIICMSM